jgi:transposase
MSQQHITERDQKILNLRVAGKSYRQIATELRIAVNTVASCVRTYEAEISAAAHSALEERLRQVGGLKAERIVASATILNLLTERFNKELVAELSAPQLLDQMIKYTQLLDKQVANLKLVFERKREITNEKLKSEEKVTYLDFDI